jgi:beta-lactamase superfamily II metal-dependent hydrolase
VALAGTCLLVLAGAWGAVAPSLAASSARLEFFDVGPGGQATLVRLADGTTVMIDGGPDGPSLETALAARLPVWQRSLDLVVLSDAQPGDAAGLQDLTDHFTLAHAADAGVLHPTQVYVAWLDALARGGVPHALVRRDDVIHLGTASSLTALSPPGLLYPARGGATTESNDLVLRLDTPGLRVLLLGAADAYALDALAFSGERLDADVVQIALPPLTAIDLVGPLGAVLEAAHPRLIVVTQAPSTSGTPRAGGPRPSALSPPDSFVGQALGAVIARTSDVGSVSLVRRSDGGWSVQH